jgi:signal transduction histidine kinase
MEHYSDSVKGRVSFCSLDFRIIKRNGEVCWIGHNCQPVYNASGKCIGQRGSNRDITERKRAEGVLMESQNQLRALAKRIDAISEEERIRIAREIHDELGHLLTAIKFDIGFLKNRSDISEQTFYEELDSISGMLDSSIDSVRRIAADLRPGILDHLGLCPAIEWNLTQFEKRTNIKCEHSLNPLNIDFDKTETTIIYRIFQEILTNVARHSKATRLSVSLSKDGDRLLFKVTDNGIGFDVDKIDARHSLGLMGMNERALSIGGVIKIDSSIGGGTAVSLLIDKK